MYKLYYQVHKNMPKIFRVTVGTQVMQELAESIKLVVIANFGKKYAQQEKIVHNITCLRGKIELS